MVQRSVSALAGNGAEILDDELEEAGWFSPDEMPELPPSGSISRKLIDEGIRLLS